MKLASAFVVVTLSLSAQSYPPKDEKSQPKKPAMKTGADLLVKTPRELLADLAHRINELPPDHIDNIVARAAEQEILAIRRILPDWCLDVPSPILFYVGFSPDDTRSRRAYRWLRLGLLVRDMYQDLPINQNILLTFGTPIAQQLSDETRYRIVARAFLEAFQWLDDERLADGLQDEDTLSSLTDVARWALHYSELAGNVDSDLFLSAALHMSELGRTLINTHPAPGLLNRATLLLTESGKIASTGLTPLFTTILLWAQTSVLQPKI